MDDKNSARRELGFARWYKEVERRFSLSDAGGARNEGGAASRGNAFAPPSIKLLAARGAAGMKSGLRFAAVALLFLAGFLGVFEAARAQTVIWSATLEAGSRGSDAGYHRADGYGTLSNANFTYKSKSFTVASFYTITTATTTYLEVPASGPRLTTDLFGTSSDPKPVTLHAGSNSWMVTGQGVSNDIFAASIAVLFDSVFTAGNTYAVSITTTEPGAPQGLTVTDASSSGVTLNWSAPSSIGGSAITGYKYRYKTRAAGGFGDWTAIPSSASLTSFAVGDLDEYTEYTFQMLAVNDSGDGLYSGEATGRTLPGQPTVTLVLDRNLIGEDGGVSTVTATLDHPSIEDISIAVSASPVDPAGTGDFTLSATKTLTITAGQTTSTGTVTITANNDDVSAPDKSVTVSGEATSEGNLTPPEDVTLTITDDDEALAALAAVTAVTAVTLTVDRTTVAEDAAASARTVTVTATLDAAAPAEGTEVTVSVTGGSAVAGTDYSTVDDFTVMIAAGDTSGTATFTLTPVDDNVDEPGETVVVTGTTTASGVSVAPAAGVTVTITDNDPPPEVTVVLTPETIAEAGGESTVTATLDRPSSAVTTITVSHTRIPPTSSSDFTLSSNKVLTIAAGQTTSTGTVTYTAVENDIHQPMARHLVVRGSAGNSQGVKQAAEHLLTIVEDDVASTKVTLSVSPVSVSEGGGARTVTVTATLDEAARPSGTPVRVSVSGGSAVAGTDFSAVEDFSLTIRSGRTVGTHTFTLTPLDDEVAEPDETVTVTGTTPDSVGLPVEPVSGLTVTIADDDAADESASTKVTLTVSPTSVAEDATGADRTVTVTAELDGESRTEAAELDGQSRTEATEVTVSVAAGTAVEGTDFSAVNNFTITIDGGDTSGTATFDLVPLDDDIDEPNETVIVSGTTAASSLTVEPEGGLTVTIADNEAAPQVTLVLDPDSISENGGSSAVTATLDRASSEATTITVSASPVSPATPDDFTLSATKTLTIAAGDRTSTGTVTVAANDNGVDEGNKSVTVSGSAVNDLAATQPDPQTLTITDDDARGVVVTPTTLMVTEGDSQSYTVVLSSQPSADVAVTATVSGDISVGLGAGDTTRTETLTFTPSSWNRAQTVTVRANPDLDVDDESVRVEHTVTGADYDAVAADAVEVRVADDGQIVEFELVVPVEPVSEGDGTVQVSVSALTDSAVPPIRDYRVNAHSSRAAAPQDTRGSFTAQSGVDFRPVSEELRFDASGFTAVTIEGETRYKHTVSFAVDIYDDALVEGTETFPVTLQPTASHNGITSLGASWSTAITILDDDALSVSVSADAGTVVEGGDATFTVEVTGGESTAPVEVGYEVTGTATPGVDYSAASGTLTLGAGESSGTIAIETLPDTVLDGGETLVVTLTGASTSQGAVTADSTPAQTTIADEGAVTVSVASDGAVVEGGDATFTVSLSGAVSEPVEVRWSTSDATASAGSDYTAVASGTVTFAALSTASQTVTVPTLGDALVEGEETFTVTLTGSALPAGVSLATATATATITDDDALSVSVSADAGTVVEGGDATFTVEVTGGESAAPVEVGYEVTGTATPGVDYSAASGTLTLGAGESSGTIAIETLPDTVLDGGETLVVTLTGASTSQGAVTADSTPAQTTIADEGALSVSVSADAGTVVEGGDATFTVEVTGGESTAPVEVGYEVTGTATPGVDYSAASGTLTLGAGESSGTIAIETLPDTVLDGGETLVVTLTGASTSQGAVTADSTPAQTTIADEGAVTVSVASDGAVVEGGDATFTVSLSGAVSEPVEVRWSTSDATASAGSDYTAVASGTVTFAALSTASQTVTVPTLGDALVEGEETFTVTLTGSALPAGVSLATATATATITDDDAPAWSVVVVPSVITEEGEVSTLTVSTGGVTFATEQAVALDLTGSTATAGVDFTLTDGNGTALSAPYGLTLGVGESSVAAKITARDDAVVEGDERVEMAVSHEGSAIGTQTVTITNRNDPIPTEWLVRFGRSVAGQVADAVSARLKENTASHVTVGGHQILASGVSEKTPSRWLEPAWWDGKHGLEETRSITGRELKTGSSFYLAAEEGDGPVLAAWGRFETGGFEAVVDAIQMDGDVTTGIVGTDVEWERWLAGAALSVSEGRGSFVPRDAIARGRDRGEFESTLTSVVPYAQVELNERVSSWVLAGHGEGELTWTAAGGAPINTDIDMTMGVLGVRGTLLTAEESGGFELIVKSDALWLRIASDEVEGMRGAQGDANRLRFTLDASREFVVGEGAALTPSLEIGVRRDGGDAETGTGVEVRAGIRYADPLRGVTIDGAARSLLAHQAADYEEWGASGSIRVDPGATGRGLSLTLAQSWANALGRTERLWSARDASGFVPDQGSEAGSQLDAELGYGLQAPRGFGAVTPYAGFVLADEGAQVWRLGARWKDPSFTLGLEGTLRERAGEAPEQSLMLRGAMRW